MFLAFRLWKTDHALKRAQHPATEILRCIVSAVPDVMSDLESMYWLVTEIIMFNENILCVWLVPKY